MGARARLAAARLLGAMALGTVSAPVAEAATSTCRVRNVTQDTAGRSFAATVGAAHDGDRLVVRGTCRARRVIVTEDVTIRGTGDRRAILDAGVRGYVSGPTGDCWAKDAGRVLTIHRGAVVRLRHLAVTGGSTGSSGGGVLNQGTLTLTDSVVRGNQTGARGGGIANLGTLTLTDSVVRGNLSWSSSGGGAAAQFYQPETGRFKRTGAMAAAERVSAHEGGVDADPRRRALHDARDRPVAQALRPHAVSTVDLAEEWAGRASRSRYGLRRTDLRGSDWMCPSSMGQSGFR